MQDTVPYKASAMALRVVNPIRATIDTIAHPTNSDKEHIPLSIGDPTVFGNMPVHKFVRESLHKVIDSGKCDGYFNASGSVEARRAVAQRFQTEEIKLTEGDVILASGCSGAILIALTALAAADDNILLPKPGFSLYPTICAYLGVECRYYNLLPDKGWEADLDHMMSLADSKTKCIIVNNPSNPCGSVWSLEHMQHILETAKKLDVPILADEVYFDMVFEGHIFHSFGKVTHDVPIIVVGGTAKRYLIPGWRLGWVIFFDKRGLLKEIKLGAYKLAQLILGPNSLVQSILPDILQNMPKDFFTDTNKLLQEHAFYLVDRISKIEGMHIIRPGGSMYVMVRIEIDKLKDIKDDVDFTQKLLTEENVFVLPGSIFGASNFVRLVICCPLDKLKIACDRMEAFCARHRKE